jgi:DNA primase catalytic subunit
MNRLREMRIRVTDETAKEIWISWSDASDPGFLAHQTNTHRFNTILDIHIGQCIPPPATTFSMDIKGLFTHNKQEEVAPSVVKEVFFDFDLQDYDLLRSAINACRCRKKMACDLCIQLTQLSAWIICQLVPYNFGYTQLLPVFSGGGGMHVWVMDEAATRLSSQERAAMLFFYELERMKDEKESDVFHSIDVCRLRLLSPRTLSLVAPYDYIFQKLLPMFRRIFIVNMNLLGDEKRSESFLNEWKWVRGNETDIPYTLREHIRWDKKCKTSAERWDSLFLNLVKGALCYKAHAVWLMTPVYNAVLSLCWPRFDRGVTLSMNHLLKAPFSVHSRTNIISVPVPFFQLTHFTLTKDAIRLSQQTDKKTLLTTLEPFVKLLEHSLLSSLSTKKKPDLSF